MRKKTLKNHQNIRHDTLYWKQMFVAVDWDTSMKTFPKKESTSLIKYVQESLTNMHYVNILVISEKIWEFEKSMSRWMCTD